MTNAEAKGSLIDIKNKYLANYGEDSIINILIDEYDIQAIDVAIQALEQEPSDDCISRQAVLEMAYDMSEIDGEHFTEPHMVVDVADIQKLKPQERTGHWYRISSHDTYYGLTDFKCSKCGEEISKEGDWLYEYCPRCGSPMMVEPQESEDKK